MNRPAQADTTLNCQAYAQKAVKQQQQNEILHCGFSGGGWSKDFQAHFNWCQLPQVNMSHLTSEDNSRTDALKQCQQSSQFEYKPGKFTVQPDKTLDILCGQYALDSRMQNQENHEFNCGFQGGHWSDDVNGHRAWCLQAGWDAALQERSARNSQLNGCKSRGRCTAESDCGSYACNLETGLCFSSCNSHAHCAKGFACSGTDRCEPASKYR